MTTKRDFDYSKPILESLFNFTPLRNKKNNLFLKGKTQVFKTTNPKINTMRTTKFIASACLTLVLLGSGVFLTNCKKDKKDPDPTPVPTPVAETNTQKLTGKNFKVTSVTVNPGFFDGNATITDWYASSYYDQCLKDNLTKFNSNGTYTEDESSVVCAGEPQTTSGTWLWNTSETILTITTGTDVTNFTVLTNDGTTLKGTVTENLGGTNYVFTSTYTKQ